MDWLYAGTGSLGRLSLVGRLDLLTSIEDLQATDGCEVFGASRRPDDADTIAPDLRKTEDIPGSGAGALAEGIGGRNGHSVDVNPSEVLPYLHLQSAREPSACCRDRAGFVNHLIDPVRSRPDVAPPVDGLRLLVEIVLPGVSQAR